MKSVMSYFETNYFTHNHFLLITDSLYFSF